MNIPFALMVGFLCSMVHLFVVAYFTSYSVSIAGLGIIVGGFLAAAILLRRLMQAMENRFGSSIVIVGGRQR